MDNFKHKLIEFTIIYKGTRGLAYKARRIYDHDKYISVTID